MEILNPYYELLDLSSDEENRFIQDIEPSYSLLSSLSLLLAYKLGITGAKELRKFLTLLVKHSEAHRECFLFLDEKTIRGNAQKRCYRTIISDKSKNEEELFFEIQSLTPKRRIFEDPKITQIISLLIAPLELGILDVVIFRNFIYDYLDYQENVLKAEKIHP